MLIKKQIILVLFSLLIIGISSSAWSLNFQQATGQLAQAKAEGLIGEMPNGYLGVVKSEGEADEIVRLINEARKKQYQKMATQNGVKLSDIETLAGQKAIAKTQSGHYIQVDGQWVAK